MTVMCYGTVLALCVHVAALVHVIGVAAVGAGMVCLT